MRYLTTTAMRFAAAAHAWFRACGSAPRKPSRSRTSSPPMPISRLPDTETALTTAQALDAAIGDLIANPSEATLNAARAAWIVARAPYQQTEVFRFGNPIVDDWEGRVNAWPLDEGLIDYVDASYGTESDANPLYTVNVIANTQPDDRRRRRSMPPTSRRRSSRMSSRRPARSRPMSRPATTPSSSCCGDRT